MTLRLIDISSYQGYPDFNRVAASGVVGVIIKASEGLGYINPTLNYDALQVAGRFPCRGFYHFALPSVSGPAPQVDFFLSAIRPYLRAGDICALDIEAGQGNLRGWVDGWMDRMAQMLNGYEGLDYSGAWFEGPHGFANDPRFLARRWEATYGSVRPANCLIWQHSSSIRIPGINGNVDEDYFEGTFGQLFGLGLGGPHNLPPISGGDMSLTADDARVIIEALRYMGLGEDAGHSEAGRGEGALIEDFVPSVVNNPEGGISALWGDIMNDPRSIWNQIKAIKAKLGMT